MLTLSVLCLLCLLGAALLTGGMLLLSLPLVIVLGLFPWLLRVAAVILLIKALLAPLRWTNFIPAAALLAISLILI